ncbi:MAG TPA: hypothetical protein VJ782_10050, partial [Aeromicrobium sp.]|nr:hypothetical protein [Aeromicrobium sp.]
MTKPNLAEFAEHLALLRNREHRAHAETPRDPFNGYERGIHLGNASAYTLALSLLHTYTDGQYG